MVMGVVESEWEVVSFAFRFGSKLSSHNRAEAVLKVEISLAVVGLEN